MSVLKYISKAQEHYVTNEIYNMCKLLEVLQNKIREISNNVQHQPVNAAEIFPDAVSEASKVDS